MEDIGRSVIPVLMMVEEGTAGAAAGAGNASLVIV